MHPGRKPTVVSISVALVCALIAACGSSTSRDADREPSDEITRTAGDDVVELTVSVQPGELTLGNTATLAVDVTASPDVTVHVDDYGEALRSGDRRFELSATRITQREAVPTDDGRRRWRYEYDVTFFLPGNYDLPPAVVSYEDLPHGDQAATDAADLERQRIETEPLSVTVLDTRTEPLTPEELADIEVPDPVELRRPWSLRLWPVLLAAVLVFGLVAYLVRRRSRSERIEPSLPAQLWAKQELAALLAEDLIARGLAQEFFYRISGIVRGYIERRFDVSAPEMTTEEFLAAAGQDSRFDASQTASLNEFLTACDLVKYARHDPSADEATGAVRAAEAFVERTRPREGPDAPDPTGGEA